MVPPPAVLAAVSSLPSVEPRCVSPEGHARAHEVSELGELAFFFGRRQRGLRGDECNLVHKRRNRV